MPTPSRSFSPTGTVRFPAFVCVAQGNGDGLFACAFLTWRITGANWAILLPCVNHCLDVAADDRIATSFFSGILLSLSARTLTTDQLTTGNEAFLTRTVSPLTWICMRRSHYLSRERDAHLFAVGHSEAFSDTSPNF